MSSKESAYELLNGDHDGPFVIICDHASNHIPAAFHDLGLGEADLRRHIAVDIGAAVIARILAQRFNSPAILCGTSRLVIDCNRHPDDPMAIPERSDGTLIPGNRSLGPQDRQARIDTFFHPYHDRIEAIIERHLARGQRPKLLSIHSMTPQMNGKFRPWQIALSSHRDRRLTEPMLKALRCVPDIVVGDNEPYDLDPAEDYSTPVHALSRGLLHLQVEFRQDEVSSDDGAARWAGIFGDALEAALKTSLAD